MRIQQSMPVSATCCSGSPSMQHLSKAQHDTTHAPNGSAVCHCVAVVSMAGWQQIVMRNVATKLNKAEEGEDASNTGRLEEPGAPVHGHRWCAQPLLFQQVSAHACADVCALNRPQACARKSLRRHDPNRASTNMYAPRPGMSRAMQTHRHDVMHAAAPAMLCTA
jgi:hypothetical protein